MSIKTEHPQYQKFKQRWAIMTITAQGDEDDVKAAGETCLPRTAGMKKDDKDNKRYEAYKMRARFPEVASATLTGVLGLLFESDPEGASEEVITNAGQSNVGLSREVLAGVASKGRDILVIDAPPKQNGGGLPYIARYTAESFINWKTDPSNPSRLTLAVFKESKPAPKGVYDHETEDVYLRYMINDNGAVELTRWVIKDEVDLMIGEPVILPTNEIPVITIGSRDLMPDCDPDPIVASVTLCACLLSKVSKL